MQPLIRAMGHGARRWRSVFLLALGLFLSYNPKVTSGLAHTEARSASAAPAETGAAVFYTTSITIPTYPYHAYLRDAYSAIYGMSYSVLDWGAYLAAPRTPIPMSYQLLVMENAYLKVTLLPELGGRIYQLIDKVTGENHLYENPVIKPTHWGPPEQGWWLAAGGIEWCLPVEEHGYEWGQPWEWDVITGTAGITVTVRDTTASSRLRAAIDVSLPADTALVRVTPRIENPTAAPIQYKFWINAGLAPGPSNSPSAGLEFVLNSNEMAVHSTGDDRFPCSMPTSPNCRFSWPTYNGTDFSRLSSWDEWLGFFEYPQAADGFVGVYDHTSDAGVVRVFPQQVARGSKAFSFGWLHPLPWDMWTDTPSGPVELHGGVMPTFWDTATLDAGASLSWSEVWYPIRSTGGISNATEEGVLHATSNSTGLSIDIEVTTARAAGTTRLVAWDISTCAELKSEVMPALTPLAPYRTSAATGGRAPEQIAIALIDDARSVLTAIGPTTCLSTTLPAPHLGYGLNVRELGTIDALVPTLGFEWVKLWEAYSGLPPQALPYDVLYLIGCDEAIDDLDAWGDHVQAIAEAGKGIVKAYEICNEPNVARSWNYDPPDPARFAEVLCSASARIRAVDRDAAVISGGLAPVGRISGTCNGWSGNDCYAMDERSYLTAMLESGAGACIDAFGYHPYGFAYTPEQDPDEVSNGFAFRGAEAMHDILVTAGYSDMPIWATEFNWLRDPDDDGYEVCGDDPEYANYFEWQEVSAATQAMYLERAFQYADTQWPWMHGMFVWNLDWHSYFEELPCLASRYYSLRRQDGSDIGAPTAAYQALAALAKRPGLEIAPRLSVEPARRMLLAGISAPQVFTTSFAIRNSGYTTFTWTAAAAPGSSLMPDSMTTSGFAEEHLWVAVHSAGRGSGTYTLTISVEAGEDTLDSPQAAQVVMRVVPELHHSYLPRVMRNQVSHAELINTAHGPSKLGLHAVMEGGTLEFVQSVAERGAHAALVKGLSFGYLCEVKRISPETITIGRWADEQYEFVEAVGDPVEKARAIMAAHMERWAPYRDCVDYWEVLNEVDPPTIEGHAWLARFFIAAMDIADTNGYRLALFSYSTGMPELYEWEAIAATGVFRRAQRSGHILALHEYAWVDSGMDAGWGEPLPIYPGQDPDDPTLPRYPDRGNMTGRYRYLYRDILIPRGEVIPLAITETALDFSNLAIRDAIFAEEMGWYDDRLREDDYVIGMAIFTLGGFAPWDTFNYTTQLPALAERIVGLKDAP